MNKSLSPGEALALLFFLGPIVALVIYGIYDWIREVIEKKTAVRANMPYKKRGSKKFVLIFVGVIVVQFFFCSKAKWSFPFDVNIASLAITATGQSCPVFLP